MAFPLLWRFYWREIKEHRKRIMLTVLAIAWGTISIVLLLGFGEGMKRQLLVAQGGLGEDIVIVWGGQTTVPYQGLGRGRRILLGKEDIELIRNAVPDIDVISGEYGRWGVTVAYGDKSVNRHVLGVSPQYGDMRSFIPERGGRFINPNDMKAKHRVAFLGTNLRDDLFGEGTNPVGETIMLEGIPFMVIGVMQDKLQMGMYSGPDEDKAVIPETTFETIFGHRYYSTVIFRPHERERAAHAEQEMRRLLGRRLKFHPDDPRALSTWSVIESAQTLQNIMVGIQIFLGIIGGLTLLVAGVGVANIMYVSIKQGTRETGIKMALGGKRRHIVQQFVMESMIIAGLGGGIGLLASGFIVALIALIPINNEALQWLGKPTISREIGVATVLILGSVGVLAGLFPARRAAAVSPVESLRYE